LALAWNAGASQEYQDANGYGEYCANDMVTTACLHEAVPYCGEINSEYVCLDTIAPGTCLYTAGQAICLAAVAPGYVSQGYVQLGEQAYEVFVPEQ
jgi:hypothetical protein